MQKIGSWIAGTVTLILFIMFTVFALTQMAEGYARRDASIARACQSEHVSDRQKQLYRCSKRGF